MTVVLSRSICVYILIIICLLSQCLHEVCSEALNASKETTTPTVVFLQQNSARSASGREAGTVGVL